MRTNKVEGGGGRVGEDAKRRVGRERCQDDLQAALVYTPLNRDGIDQTPPGSGQGAGLLGREDGRARGLERGGNQEPGTSLFVPSSSRPDCGRHWQAIPFMSTAISALEPRACPRDRQRTHGQSLWSPDLLGV